MKNLNNIKKLALTLLISGLFAATSNSFGIISYNGKEIDNKIQRELLIAVSNANIENIKEILHKYPDKIDINSGYGIPRTVYKSALFLHLNRDIDEFPFSFSNSPLTEAISLYTRSGNVTYLHIIKLLMDNGAIRDFYFEEKRKQLENNKKFYNYDNSFKKIVEPEPLKIKPRAERYHDVDVHTN